ncbi:MAG TPA: MYXO-CTERM sorting domain-containing protein, partial [Phycisphaerales bacterium]|nr:MYXO-CTERM sorting domain-containing protein [Phycisphaerales bacterium]
DGGQLEIRDGGNARVNGLFNIDGGSLYGAGTLSLFGNGPAAMIVDGHIQADTDVGLTINQLGAGRIDLDGTVAGDDTLNITGARIDGSAFARLTINGDQLTDDFDDHLWLSDGNSLDMNLSGGWTFGAGADLRVSGSSQFNLPSEINGGLLTFNGDAEIVSGGHLQMNAPLVLSTTASALLSTNTRMELNGATTVNGGTYTVGDGASIQFDGATTIRGGAFSTPSQTPADGLVEFNGPTTWDGDISVAGFARQNGAATVAGPSTVNAQGATFDIDGAFGSTTWSIGNALTINAAHVETDSENVHSAITIAGTFLGRLTVNLDDPNASWVMAGEMNLGGVANIPTVRVAGSALEVYGNLNITNRIIITADTTLAPGSDIAFQTPTSSLRTDGLTRVAATVGFTGGGTLHNSATGTLNLLHGASTGQTALLNQGQLDVGASPGSASVWDFTQEATGNWHVELGGYALGTEFDHLIVTGGQAHLAGTVTVSFLDLGGGLFAPQVGDTFLILFARNGREGVFQSDPVTVSNGLTYHWGVTYTATDVVLELQSITPAPGSAALLGLGGLAAMRRRRR